VTALETGDFAALRTDQITSLTTSNIAVLSTAEIVAITTAQIRVLSTAQLLATSTQNIAAIQVVDVQAMTTLQVAALTTAQVLALVRPQQNPTDFSIILAGSIRGSLDEQINNGGMDAFVAKFDPAGKLIWSKTQGTSGDEGARGAVAAPDGSVYVSGNTNSNLDGQANNGGSSDGYLSKFSKDGSHLWTKLIGTSSDDAILPQPVIAKDGSIYVAGRTYGNLDGNVLLGSADVFVSKFFADGRKAWTKTFGTPSEEYPFNLTTDQNNEIYLSGVTQGNLGGNGYAGGDWDGFVAKLSSDGAVSWIKGIGTNGMDSADVVRTGPDGSIYVAGGTGGSLNGQAFLGGGTLSGWPPNEKADAYLTKYDADGNLQWTKAWGTTTYDRARDMVIGTDGNIYVAGTTDGNLGGIANNGVNTVFLSSFKPDGSIIRTTLFGNPAKLQGPKIGYGPDGKLYLSAYTTDVVNGVTGKGGSDVVFAQLNTDGTPNWVQMYGSYQDDGAGLSIAVSGDGNWKYLPLTTTQVSALTSAGLNALGANDLIDSLGTDLLTALATAQISALTTASVIGLTVDQAAALLTSQIVSLTTSNIAVLSTAQMVAITTAQAKSLTVAQIQALTTRNLAVMESADVRAMATAQVAALTTAQVVALLAPTPVVDGSWVVAGEAGTSLNGQTTLDSADGFIAKYDANGNRVWTRLIGSSQEDWVLGTITSTDNSMLVGGNTYGSFDGQTNKGMVDGFITKYMPDGSRAWTRMVGSDRYDQINAMVSGGKGALIVVGETMGSLEGEISQGGQDGFISKYDANGTRVWSNQFGSEENDAVLTVSVGADGGVLVGGFTGGDLEGEIYQGMGDGFIRKYAADGTLIWTRILGSTQTDWVKTSAIGADGSLLIGGVTFGDLDGNASPNNGDGIISKFDADGNVLWTRLVATAESDTIMAMTLTDDGSVLVAGTTFGDLDGQTHAGNGDGFISKYDAQGIWQWTRLAGTNQSDQINAIISRPDGTIGVSGYADAGIDGQSGQGGGDAFFSEYDADGNLLLTRVVGSDQTDAAYALESGLRIDTRPLALGASQIAALSSAQLGGLGVMNLLVGLSTEQMVFLSTGQVGALSPRAVDGLSTNQLIALETKQIAALTSAQVRGLSTDSLAALTTLQYTALTTAQIASLTTGQIPNLETADIVALSTAQVMVLSTAQVQALSTSGLAAMTTAQIAVWTSSQVAALLPTNLISLSRGGLSSGQIESPSTQVFWTGNSHIYEFVNVQNGIPWSDAEVVANSKNIAGFAGYLATITSAQEDSFVFNALVKRQDAVYGTSTKNLLNFTYIGASDAEIEGQWKWTGGPETGQLLAAGYSNWAPYEPNNSGSQNYLAYFPRDYGAAFGVWDDHWGSARPATWYVIEYSSTTPSNIALTSGQMKSLTTAQIDFLGSADLLSRLDAAQISALSVSQVNSFNTTDIRALRDWQFASLTSAQISAISSTNIAALTTSAIFAITTLQMQALSSSQISVFDASQVAALSITDLAVMTTAQLGFLPCGLSTAQKAVLTAAQKDAYIATPIMLDLNGDGVQTLGLDAGVQFDVRANGLSMQTGWVSAQDGLLVMDRNADGSINDGSELFGSSTVLADGTRAHDGYQALAALDSNGDGMISRQDAVFAQLRVWVDANSDGLSAPDELRTLDGWGIASISTQAFASTQVNNGNVLGLVSSYQTTDGQTHQAADVWFGAALEDVVPTAARVNALTQALGEFAQAQAAPSNQEAVAPSLTQPAANSTLAVNQSLVAALQSYQSQAQSQQAMACANAAVTTSANLAGMAAPVESSTRLSGMAMSPSDPQQPFQLAALR
jgi:hypothetical protein